MRRERDASIRSTKRCTLAVHPLIISMTLTAALKDVNRARRTTLSQALVAFIAERTIRSPALLPMPEPPKLYRASFPF